VFPSPAPAVRRVPLERPWAWLASGWNDFIRVPLIGLAYGGLFVAFGLAAALCFYAADRLYLLLPVTAGFALVAPALAVGLYDVSRRLALGETPTLGDALRSWQRNAGQIAAFGFVLLLIHLVWVRIALLLFPIFFTGGAPALDGLPDLVIESSAGLAFLVTGALIGGVIATGVFAISAVSIPMLLDRDVSFVTAMATSFVAVRANARPLALWAAIVAVATVIGLMLFYVGLAVTLPLVAYASWHCYKDLVA
jgi:uncharacterized membrane protein